MAAQPEDVLEQLVKEVEEARSIIRQVHEAEKQYKNLVKASKEKILEEIFKEIRTAVQEIKVEAADEMRGAVTQVIAKIASDWRFKLGLPA